MQELCAIPTDEEMRELYAQETFGINLDGNAWPKEMKLRFKFKETEVHWSLQE